MTPDESLALVDSLLGSHNLTPNRAVYDAYYRAWGSMNYREVSDAVDRFLANDERRPTPAGVLKYIKRESSKGIPIDAAFAKQWLMYYRKRGLVAVPEVHGKLRTFALHPVSACAKRVGQYWNFHGVKIPLYVRVG